MKTTRNPLTSTIDLSIQCKKIKLPQENREKIFVTLGQARISLIQYNTISRYHYIHIRTPIIRKTSYKMLARRQCTWNFSYTMDGMQNGSVTWENSLAHEIKHTYIYNAAIIPSHLPKRSKNACLYKTFRQMFIALLFIITKNRKENKCLSTGIYKTKVWHIHTMVLVSSERKRQYCYTQRHGWVSDTLCQVKEDRFKRPH